MVSRSSARVDKNIVVLVDDHYGVSIECRASLEPPDSNRTLVAVGVWRFEI